MTWCDSLYFEIFTGVTCQLKNLKDITMVVLALVLFHDLIHIDRPAYRYMKLFYFKGINSAIHVYEDKFPIRMSS